MHYMEYGNRDASFLMLFLHGGGVSGWMWDKQVQYFARYHCIVPDLPEHGLSHDGAAFSIQGSAEECLRILDEKAAGRKVAVTGFSLGSQVLIQMLSLKPEAIDFAIIICHLEYQRTSEKPQARYWLQWARKKKL